MPIDYADTGLTIQQALVQENQARKGAPLERDGTPSILWGGKKVVTAHSLAVPPKGSLELRLIHRKGDLRQGCDISIPNGGCILRGGEVVSLLRTWWLPEFEDSVSYEFVAREKRLFVWNVYEMVWPGGRKTEEKWTDNAGMWVEDKRPGEIVYHCSAGPAVKPTFDDLVFSLLVREPPS
ncbi:MAG TPA: hypothetical protein VEP66_12765 [Myxococcales bacterium]|nr:hypothetical protein [Myxococcales bacterium]